MLQKTTLKWIENRYIVAWDGDLKKKLVNVHTLAGKYLLMHPVEVTFRKKSLSFYLLVLPGHPTIAIEGIAKHLCCCHLEKDYLKGMYKVIF